MYNPPNCDHNDFLSHTNLHPSPLPSLPTPNDDRGKTNLKIGALNVCGLKSRINCPEFIQLIEQYSILCVSETKLDIYDLIEIPNYTFYSKPRSEQVKRKSGGLGFFVHNSLISRINILESNCDYIFWLKYEDTCNTEYVIGALYVPPEQSRYFNNDEFFSLENDIQSKCSQYTNILITGDANAHTSNETDCIDLDDFISSHFDLDEDTLNSHNQENHLTNLGIPLSRVSKCNKVNRSGRRLLDICKHNNLYILNGRVGSDNQTGQFTFRDTSVIDYSLASASLLSLIDHFEVIDLDRLYSDGHSLISTHLVKNDAIITHNNHTQNNKTAPKWKDDKNELFTNNLNIELLAEINQTLQDCTVNDSKNCINTVTEKISNLFHTSAMKTFSKNNNCRRGSENNNVQADNPPTFSKPWFGPQCRKARTSYNTARKTYQLHKNAVNKRKLNTASKFYKQTINTYINKHRHSNERLLRDMNSRKPKDYWRYINSVSKKKTPKAPDIDEFYEYLKNLNTGHDPNENIPDMEDLETPPILSMEQLNMPISTKEIEDVISKSKNGKAASQQDHTLNEYLKNTKSVMVPIYSQLFNKVLYTGVRLTHG